LKKLLVALLILLLVGVSVVAWREHRQLIRFRTSISNVGQFADLELQLLEARREVSSLKAQSASFHNNASSPPIFGQKMKKDGIDTDTLKRMLKDIDGNMSVLWRRLGLTQAQIIKAETSIAMARYATGDALNALRARGFDQGKDPQGFDAAFKPERDAIEETENRELQSVLGASGFAQYQQFWQNANTEEFVNRDVQDYLGNADVPLTDSQSEQLVQLMAQMQYRSSAGLNDQGFAAASGILTPQQIKSLQQFQKLLAKQWSLQNQLDQVRSQLNPVPRSTP
jgi:hypothetical protein